MCEKHAFWLSRLLPCNSLCVVNAAISGYAVHFGKVCFDFAEYFWLIIDDRHSCKGMDLRFCKDFIQNYIENICELQQNVIDVVVLVFGV